LKIDLMAVSLSSFVISRFFAVAPRGDGPGRPTVVSQPALREALDDEDREVRIYAAEALRSLADGRR